MAFLTPARRVALINVLLEKKSDKPESVPARSERERYDLFDNLILGQLGHPDLSFNCAGFISSAHRRENSLTPYTFNWQLNRFHFRPITGTGLGSRLVMQQTQHILVLRTWRAGCRDRDRHVLVSATPTYSYHKEDALE
jgi:hypothetical protein